MADIDAQPKSVQVLYEWYANKRLLVNRRYQRKLVWTLEEKRELIQSIRSNYPIPSVLVAETAENNYEIIDGLQRLFSIFSFLENAYSTTDNKYFNIEEFPAAKLRSEEIPFPDTGDGERITRAEVVALIGYNVPISIMRDASEYEINEVFRRINTYGRRLSEQDRRQSGVQDNFANMIRKISSSIRGDSSSDIIDLGSMPSISIDLPKTNHGYGVQSDQTYWVKEGILRSTDLRDSEDEQCIADIAACIVGGKLISRSKDALDDIYRMGSSENTRMNEALAFYGEEKFVEELHYCIYELQKCCEVDQPVKLKSLLFEVPSNNSFSAIFAAITVAFHRVLIQEKRKISDYTAVRAALNNLNRNIDTGRGATTVTKRERNIIIIASLIRPHTVADNLEAVYTNHSYIQIDERIQRSAIESSGYELKQGLLSLSESGRKKEPATIEKICKNICAIANNGPNQDGVVILGIADKKADADRIEKLDGVSPMMVGKKYVVGLTREARKLGISNEEYFALWRDGIANSALSDPLRADVLSNMTWNNYHGLGLIIITIPRQNEMSFYGETVYIRVGDTLQIVTAAMDVVQISKRFS
ncbi:DUF262 domain-containing protein [Nocardia cyriacigeorgica]|uniref:DUF262 domain-containing protein n=1 Tax=Nocardia cyriacigeorgica TaxID=135487 RepID=UPI002457D504|nr:DUF262 domain-containing protein [Nocardia cyriacigeorgica]